MIEKFTDAEAANLRNELMRGGLDSFQVAEVIKMFIERRGYGISPETALEAASRLDVAGCNPELFHRELEGFAMAM